MENKETEIKKSKDNSQIEGSQEVKDNSQIKQEEKEEDIVQDMSA